MNGAWESERLAAVVIEVVVPVDQDLENIGMHIRKMLVHMEFNYNIPWIRSLKELWTTQSVDQWVDWITIPSPVQQVPNIYCIISLFPITNKNNGIPDPEINP